MTDMLPPGLIAQIIRKHDRVVVRRIVGGIEQRRATTLEVGPKALERRHVGPDLVEVAAAEFGEARGLVTEPLRNAVLGAISLSHTVNAAASLVTPRGQTRSTSKRAPSSGLA